ncbi:MAG: hypothetical protein EYC62_02430 [Alphaproteobacteria bacterium]|nr:MAG: hypothetical protein EYC62_02430 [Alphaproteobacteria bacterium]
MPSVAQSKILKSKLHIVTMEVFYTPSVRDSDVLTIAQEIEILKSDLLADQNIHLPVSQSSFFKNCHFKITAGADHYGLAVENENGEDVICQCSIPYAVIKPILSDYLKICDSYKSALKEGGQARLESIDMGRRGLHNDAADQLISMLKPAMEIDFMTARHLFALLSTIHRSS